MFRYIAFITTNHHQTHPSLCHWCLLTIATTLKKKTSFNQLEKIIKSSSYWISKENYLKFFCVCNIVYYIFDEMYLYQYQYSFNMQNPHFHVSFQPYIGNMIIGNILQSIHSLHSTALLHNSQNLTLICFYSHIIVIEMRILLDYEIFPHFNLFILRKLCNKMSAGVPVGL